MWCGKLCSWFLDDFATAQQLHAGKDFSFVMLRNIFKVFMLFQLLSKEFRVFEIQTDKNCCSVGNFQRRRNCQNLHKTLLLWSPYHLKFVTKYTQELCNDPYSQTYNLVYHNKIHTKHKAIWNIWWGSRPDYCCYQSL